MNAPAIEKREEGRIFRDTPFLSHSRINRYLHCPEQYRLYYVENFRPRSSSANLIFGQVVHQALAHFFQTQLDPVKYFLESWQGAKQLELTYSQRDSWEKLQVSGQGLLTKFLADEFPKLHDIRAVEQRFEIEVTSLDVPFVGVIDLMADLDKKRTVVDFKTSGTSYEEHEVVLSDQLTAYQLAAPEAEQAALCVLVKTKEPRIEWHVATRTSTQFQEFLAKARLIGGEIAAGRFYKRPGKWCGWCEFLPVCLGDHQQTEATLIRIP